MGKIYGLRCPKTNNFRYIGKTTGTLSYRLKRHIREALKYKNSYTHKELWIRSLYQSDLLNNLQIEEIEHVNDNTLSSREIHWIAHYRQLYDLTNTSDGGDGNAMRGPNHPNYGKKFSDETRAKISESKKGANNPMYGRRSQMTAEHKQSISSALKNSEKFKNKKADPEYIDKIKTSLSRPTYLIRLDGTIRSMYYSCKDIARDFGVTFGTVCNARRFNATFRKTYKIIYVKDYHEQYSAQIPTNISFTVVDGCYKR